MKQQKLTPKNPSLEELVFGALSQLQELHYNGRSIRRYQSVWNRLIKFAKQNKFENKLSRKLIEQFLEHYDIKPKGLITTEVGWRKHAECSLKMLWLFSRYGYFDRIRTFMRTLNISPSMKKVLEDYASYCKEKHYISDYCYNERIRQIVNLSFLKSSISF